MMKRNFGKLDMMKNIVFVTTNEGKIAYANSMLPDINVIPYEYELIEPRGDDVKQIAIEKAKQAFNILGVPCIAMDIGFFIESLNGFPRAYVNHALETIGIDGIMKLMSGIENRYCEFRECLAFFDGTTMEVFQSIEPASISESICGNKHSESLSDLWYIVKPDGFNKTLAQFTDEELTVHRKTLGEPSIKQFGEWYHTKFK